MYVYIVGPSVSCYVYSDGGQPTLKWTDEAPLMPTKVTVTYTNNFKKGAMTFNDSTISNTIFLEHGSTNVTMEVWTNLGNCSALCQELYGGTFNAYTVEPLNYRHHQTMLKSP